MRDGIQVLPNGGVGPEKCALGHDGQNFPLLSFERVGFGAAWRTAALAGGADSRGRCRTASASASARATAKMRALSAVGFVVQG